MERNHEFVAGIEPNKGAEVDRVEPAIGKSYGLRGSQIGRTTGGAE
jgi:hypothetical protein